MLLRMAEEIRLTFTVNRQPSIQLLPEHLIDQIQAGEVIERPSSLIKEILENSVDAKSTKIELSLINNGLDQILIKDNGIGISFKELPYAFCRHATSKIKKFDDLYKLHSYGFRGEALASMASVAKVNCISRRQGEEGGQITFEGGEETEYFRQDSLEVGTQITIRDLFFNTPVRLKFIQSGTSEKNSIRKIISSYLIAHPEIEFHIKWDDKDKKIYPITTQEERFRTLIGRKKSETFTLIEISYEYENINLQGHLLLSYEPKSFTKDQFLLVNKRPVQEKSLHHLMVQTCIKYGQGLQLNAYNLDISLPPEKLDVNVHPNKTVVKFSDQGLIQSLTREGIKKSLIENISLESTLNESVPEQSQELLNVQYDLKDKTDQAHRDVLPQNSHLLSNQINGDEENYITQFINDQFFLIKNKTVNDFFICDFQKLMKSTIKSRMSTNLPQEIIPLIISIPFELDKSLQNEEALLELEQKGLEFDEIQKGMFLLRTIPKSLDGFPIKESVSFYLGLEILFNRNSFGMNEILKTLNSYSLSQLIEYKIVSQLTSKKIEKLFNE